MELSSAAAAKLQWRSSANAADVWPAPLCASMSVIAGCAAGHALCAHVRREARRYIMACVLAALLRTSYEATISCFDWTRSPPQLHCDCPTCLHPVQPHSQYTTTQKRYRLVTNQYCCLFGLGYFAVYSTGCASVRCASQLCKFLHMVCTSPLGTWSVTARALPAQRCLDTPLHLCSLIHSLYLRVHVSECWWYA